MQIKMWSCMWTYYFLIAMGVASPSKKKPRLGRHILSWLDELTVTSIATVVNCDVMRDVWGSSRSLRRRF